MAADALRPFEAWISKRKELWTHLHLAAVALRLGDDWFVVSGAVLMAPSDEAPARAGCPIFETPEICSLRLVAPADLLPTLAEDIRRGVIPAGRIPELDRNLRIECPVGMPLIEDGASEYTRPGMVSFGRGDALRFEARLRGPEVVKLFAEPLACQELLQRLDRECEGAGQGSISEMCDDLRLRDYQGGGFNIGAWVTFRLEAALPFRLVRTEQNPARTCVEVTLAIPESTPRENLQVVYRPKVPGRTFAPVAVPPGGPSVTFVVANQPAPGDGEAILSYARQKVDSQNVHVRPPLQVWPALVAMSALDSDLTLLREGLSGEDATRHERAVSHLLGLLGFSVFWWGPNVKQKHLPLPKDAPDVVLCSNDQQIIIVVECTTEQLGDKKLRYLVDRTRGVQEELRKKFPDDDGPFVRPLLALARPRTRVPGSLLDLVQADHAGILTTDDALDLLNMVATGVPRAEQRRRFDELFLHPELPLPGYWPEG
ncbi:MAG TPA: hypothetical protein VHH90_05925 [Polyangia bacterium]|nr:hypothetical protein [Polyangia bacterium]